ncbi:MAG TPA: helix-turn-helix domain-containing protein [Pseudolabrys sp.]|jgi:DNA-binding HxlR family transcriptional regulator|nr:helix-turn-helix domain-containing protein [Pseudolabrys sp.]
MPVPRKNDEISTWLGSESAATHHKVRERAVPREDPWSCPLGLAINTIGGRWKLHILRALLLGGPARYNQVLRLIDGISAKELTRNLRELESAGLVVTSASGKARTYSLTPLGMELEAPFRALGIFGAALATIRG